jgi:hypothetical protein
MKSASFIFISSVKNSAVLVNCLWVFLIVCPTTQLYNVANFHKFFSTCHASRKLQNTVVLPYLSYSEKNISGLIRCPCCLCVCVCLYISPNKFWTSESTFMKFAIYIVTNLLKVLLGNSPVNTFQHTGHETILFSSCQCMGRFYTTYAQWRNTTEGIMWRVSCDAYSCHGYLKIFPE